MVKIREITPSEYEILPEMLYEAIYFADEREKASKSIIQEPHLAKYVENFGKLGDHAFVLVDKDELVGAAWSRLFPESEKGYGFVDEKTPEFSIAVKEPYRNQGYGRLMIERLFEKLKSEGYRKLSLSVDARSVAVNLHRRIGFEIVAEEGTSYTMLKEL